MTRITKITCDRCGKDTNGRSVTRTDGKFFISLNVGGSDLCSDCMIDVAVNGRTWEGIRLGRSAAPSSQFEAAADDVVQLAFTAASEAAFSNVRKEGE